jgi:sulfite reductase (NADPH) hemoprotein beta-component
VNRLEELLERHGLEEEPISIRMTGCPNGCARPHLAEIGLIGRAPGIYDLYLGGDAIGYRMNRLHAVGLDEAGILDTLDGLFAEFAAGRSAGEGFGDYIYRRPKDGVHTQSSKTQSPDRTGTDSPREARP